MKSLFIIALTVIFFSCGSNKTAEVKKDEISPREVTPLPPKPEEPKWQPVSFKFIPVKLEIAELDDRKMDTSYTGEGCDCPTVGNKFGVEVYFFDSLGGKYGITINGFKLLKSWHNAEGPKDMINANLDSLPRDTTNYYLSSKNVYLKIISSLPGDLRVFVDSLYEGGQPNLRIFLGEPKQKKTGNAYVKGEYENLLYADNAKYP